MTAPPPLQQDATTVNDKEQALAAIGRLADIMDRLRDPGGCEWDRAQTFATIAPYTLEEAYEVSDAIARNDMPDLCEELGDLLLQVVFHARMAAEAGHFTLTDVANAICAKMERRHPHIFGADAGPASADEVRATWEDIKAAEKPRDSVLDGVALALPALTRAEKLANRAARKGFDWPDASGPLAKIHEELAEVAAATTDAERTEEAGDLLFATANYARKLGVDPEQALRGANDKFEQRFRKIEKVSGFEDMSLDQQEHLWQSAKRLP
ncbi:nucleoside triphosphate pyrophosphohydrolase [Sandaracinobacter neustonicus]|uniref:Nucleoside triphosphate pyrophosphohydrolase n=1 Tax=Sandaracinobacter neustonicus TaxID=1715348 RepID=A0A501XEM1_9SPHN|nr:nucleoside triphosphate pyrophosphohydrolase [Sandaracinobacter neustonicus]TPE59041.1 nucleoside triphosphate pyrophosphohydrolase [Sandaracinobacter neustonicus]